MQSTVGSRRALRSPTGLARASALGAKAEIGLDPIRPRSVQQETVDRLRSAILAGIFKPGDRMVETDLCERLGVSRPSIREALRSLEAERLVLIVPNRGPQVPILTWPEAAEIYQVRALLEGEAAALCAQRAGPADLRRLKAALTAFAKAMAASDGEGRLGSTAEFYGHVLELCGNRIIKETLERLHARVKFLRGRSMSVPGRARMSLREMTAILDAIAAADPEAARNAAMFHVREAQGFAKLAYDKEAEAL